MLVVGVEKMTELAGPAIGETLLRCSYVNEEKAHRGRLRRRVRPDRRSSYFQRHGDQSDALAAIAAKNHKNGCANPWAQMRKDLGYEFCRKVSDKNPIVAGPLKRTDCSLVSDGAAALVLADVETALGMSKAVAFRACGAGQRLPADEPARHRRVRGLHRGLGQGAGAARASTLDDLDLVETHDCFTIAELLEYEAMGLTAQGQGSRAILEGWTAEGRPAAGQPLRRPQGQGPPDRRHRRLDARADRDAGPRRGRRDAGRGCEARRRLQHGRRLRRQLRQHPGAAAVTRATLSFPIQHAHEHVGHAVGVVVPDQVRGVRREGHLVPVCRDLRTA